MTRIVAVLMGTLLAGGLAAQDWNQWRGPSRDGQVPKGSAPQQWPASYRPAWRTEVGEGYSSPVVAGGRVFVHSRRDPDEVVTALDAGSGKIVWQQKYSAGYQKNQYAVKMGKGPNATPAVSGGRVFTIGATAIVTAWDAATGRVAWRKDFSKSVDLSKLFCGTAASPLVVDGSVIAQTGSDTHGGVITAFDTATGAVRWEWRGAGPGYASPVAISVSGTTQLVTLTNQSVVGIDVKTGKQLWTIAFPDEWHENIVTPVWTGSHLVVSGTRQGTHAYSLKQDASGWTGAQAWKNPQVSMYMSTPVYADGLIYGLSDKRKGYFVALDGATGAVKWQSEGREGRNAAVLLLPSDVVFLTDAGDLAVIKRGGSGLKLERRYKLGLEETWAAPVILGRDLVVKDASSVSRLNGM